MYTFNCKSRLTTPLFSSPWTTKYPRYIQLHSVASTCAGHQAAWFPHQASFPYIPQPGCPLFLLFCSLHLQFLTMTLTCVRHRVAWCSSKASFPYIPQPECTSCSQPTYWSIPHQLSFLESFAVYNVHCTYNMLSITFTPDLGQDLFHPADNLVISLSPQSPLTSLKLIKTLNVSLNFPLAPNWGQSSIIPFTPSLTSTLTELGYDFSSSSSGPPLCSISSNMSLP